MDCWVLAFGYDEVERWDDPHFEREGRLRVFVGEDYVCMMDDVFEPAIVIVECGLDGAEMG